MGYRGMGYKGWRYRGWGNGGVGYGDYQAWEQQEMGRRAALEVWVLNWGGCIHGGVGMEKAVPHKVDMEAGKVPRGDRRAPDVGSRDVSTEM